jgi:hypothetical protein
MNPGTVFTNPHERLKFFLAHWKYEVTGSLQLFKERAGNARRASGNHNRIVRRPFLAPQGSVAHLNGYIYITQSAQDGARFSGEIFQSFHRNDFGA